MIGPEVDTAVIFAAGVGTRDLPLTKLRGKDEAELYGQPLIGRKAAEYAGIGIKNLVIVTGDEVDDFGQNIQRMRLERWFEDSERYAEYLVSKGKHEYLSLLEQGHNLKIDYVEQPNDGIYGTARPLHLAKQSKLIAGVLGSSGMFVAGNGDDLTYRPEGGSIVKDFIDDTLASGSTHGILVKPIPRLETGSYSGGVVFEDANGRLENFLENPDSSLVQTNNPKKNLGVYLFNSSVFDSIDSLMEMDKDERGHEEFQLPRVFPILMSKGETVHVSSTTDEFLDAGDPNSRLLASLTIAGVSPDVIEQVEKQLKPKAWLL